ncbi:putative membrane protein [Desulfosporosinus sp. OT]|nr:putative membrane protein [Desulfosporosinus sp. OT]
MAFQFFFQAAAGITTGVASVILPCLYLYNRLFNNGRSSRG